jgi:methionine aminopeptidase, type I
MITYKTDEEIEFLRESNLLVSRTLAEVARYIAPGVTTLSLDKIAEEFIRDNGADPGFLGYDGFPGTLCISINDAVVHGIPSERRLQDGDIVSLDCGVLKNGFYGDSAFTFEVGLVADNVKKLLKVTRECLSLGVEKVEAGNRIGDISSAVQENAENNGFSVVREMVGHGLGRNLHESPEVPNYGRRGQGPMLKNGLVICIEPMINLGKRQIFQEKDGWTIRTQDGKPSAHFELAVAVKNGKADVLSTFKFIDEFLERKA